MCAGRAAQALLLSEPCLRHHASPHLVLRGFNPSQAVCSWPLEVLPQAAQGTEREQHKPCAKVGKTSIFLPSPSKTCVYWKIFTAEKGEIAGVISTERAGIAGRCFWIYINPKDPASTVCFASCTLGVEVVMTAAPLPLPVPPFPASTLIFIILRTFVTTATWHRLLKIFSSTTQRTAFPARVPFKPPGRKHLGLGCATTEPSVRAPGV